jgi:hypothetical protein
MTTPFDTGDDDVTAEELPVNDLGLDDDGRSDPATEDQAEEGWDDDVLDDPDLKSARELVDHDEESLGTDDLLPDEPFSTD